ncbi:MAG: trypsin-like peptidase domain-containing protein [Candidatus Delongbacteria bacterium]|jgi:serine protease Do|nr:trypsin-like peptidase domain-containing protein [Candidatus Delongbacteria bacterium]
MDNFKTFILGLITGSLILGVFYFYTQHGTEITPQKIVNSGIELATLRESAITKAVKDVSPAVVGINVVKVKKQKVKTVFDNDPFFSNFFPPQYRNKAMPSAGSGFIYSPEGYIITNNHVIDDARQIIITTTESKEYQAKIVGFDEISDIAVLKIDAEDHAYAKLSDEELIRGEWVIAFGNPYGLFEYVNNPLITVGVISGVNINFGFSAKDRHFYESMIQTDASINPGNSGGPLVNSDGEVVGMNTMIYSKDGGGSIGIGFAIPINKVINIANTLIQKGFVNRSFYFGFKLADLPVENTGERPKGVFVELIQDNSPAEKAGLQKGDIIIAVGNVKINNYKEMGKALFIAKDYIVGDKVKIIVLRDSKELKLVMTLEAFEK